MNSAVIRAGEIFREAVRSNAPAVILAHNHPSGDPAPSDEDVQITRRIIDAGKLLDIEVLDPRGAGAEGVCEPEGEEAGVLTSEVEVMKRHTRRTANA